MPHADVVALLEQGNAAQARALLLQHPETGPEQDFLLGACCHLLGEIPAALQHFTQALKQDARHARAAAALSTLYDHLGRPDLAEQLLRQTLQKVDDLQLRFNLAAVLERLDRRDEALAGYHDILQQQPDHFGSRLNRAGLHALRMQLREAASDYRELIKRHPAQTLPWQNLADIEISAGHYQEALALLAEVRRRQPDNAKALQSQAIALAVEGDFANSDAAFRELKQRDPALWDRARQRVDDSLPASAEIDSRLIYLVRQHEHLEACQWQSWEATTKVWQAYLRQPGAGLLKPLAYRAMCVPTTVAEQRELARRISRQFAPADVFTWTPTPTPQRLRIAYMSSDFRQHATGQLTRQLFAAHDRQQVEVTLIYLAPADASIIAADIRRGADHVIDVSTRDDDEAAALIAGQAFDILVDLNGYTTGARPALLERKIAPLQLHWLIMTSSTGSATMDYYIADAQVSPGGNWCTEAEVHLPGSYFIFSHDDKPPLVPARQLLGLPEGHFVFCCLNASHKIDPETFSIWMEVLKETQDSVLWLLGSSTATVMNLKREAEWRGVDPRRLLFAPKVAQAQHIARMGAADLFLDTRYYNAHTTAAEALWAGLPVLTCPGETYASRVGKSLLLDCGLPELVAADWATYRELALRAVRDPAWLQGLRERLAENRGHASVFNIPRQARYLEKAYRHMRERFAQGLPPAPFNIADLPD
ncbi:MAG TPA: tetratricopeptide repeat protein [Moraxellaceae bacterium]